MLGPLVTPRSLHCTAVCRVALAAPTGPAVALAACTAMHPAAHPSRRQLANLLDTRMACPIHAETCPLTWAACSGSTSWLTRTSSAQQFARTLHCAQTQQLAHPGGLELLGLLVALGHGLLGILGALHGAAQQA